jgi:hypothetical protein
VSDMFAIDKYEPTKRCAINRLLPPLLPAITLAPPAYFLLFLCIVLP